MKFELHSRNIGKNHYYSSQYLVFKVAKPHAKYKYTIREKSNTSTL